jgi:hypothetical protein
MKSWGRPLRKKFGNFSLVCHFPPLRFFSQLPYLTDNRFLLVFI